MAEKKRNKEKQLVLIGISRKGDKGFTILMTADWICDVSNSTKNKRSSQEESTKINHNLH